MIIKALESLATSYTNDTLKNLIEKYYRTNISIEVQFGNEETGLMEEYFPDCPMLDYYLGMYEN